jgi:RNA polymerase sigma-70 factor (ECF subfamily)
MDSQRRTRPDGITDIGGAWPVCTSSKGTHRKVFDRYADRVYDFCFRRTASWSVAEAAMAAAFLEVWRIRDRATTYGVDLLAGSDRRGCRRGSCRRAVYVGSGPDDAEPDPATPATGTDGSSECVAPPGVDLVDLEGLPSGRLPLLLNGAVQTLQMYRAVVADQLDPAGRPRSGLA